jgi:ATP-dependent Lon protease
VKKDRRAHLRLTTKSLAKYLGPARYRISKAEEEDKIGVVTGLAWTDMGGELLATEVTVMPGKGKLTVTGKIGDVMQESAQAAMSYVRSRAGELGLEKDFYQKVDIHIHIPEGAIPKDGPSAGVTMVTALVSALAKLAVRHDTAMTGEITLRGRVLPIGGLKEKILAAHRGGITRVLVPLENKKDLQEVPIAILKAVQIETVEHMDEVLRKALVIEDPDSFLSRKKDSLGQETLYPPETNIPPSSSEIVAH